MIISISRREWLAALAAVPAAIGAPKPGTIRVGCQANGFPIKQGDFPGLLKVLAQMKELGYTGFECNIRFVQDQFPRASAARKEIEATGVRFIGPHYNMQQAAKPGAFPGVVEGAAALGAECIVMSGSGLSKDGKFEPDAAKKKAEELNSLGQACRKGGLKLAYHNHNPEFANGNAEENALAANTNPEYVSFLMDAGHGYLGGGNPAEFMARHSARIYGCHLKTFKGQQQVPLGKGDFDFQALAAAIKKTGWHGWLITEEGGGPTPGDTAAVGPDRQYIRKVFGV